MDSLICGSPASQSSCAHFKHKIPGTHLSPLAKFKKVSCRKYILHFLLDLHFHFCSFHAHLQYFGLLLVKIHFIILSGFSSILQVGFLQFACAVPSTRSRSVTFSFISFLLSQIHFVLATC
jgi:hypothetical protein